MAAALAGDQVELARFVADIRDARRAGMVGASGDTGDKTGGWGWKPRTRPLSQAASR